MHTAHRFWDIKARQDIPGRDQGEHHCGGNLEAGGQVCTHDAHMCKVVQSQKLEQQKPEELACMHSKWHCLLKHTHVASVNVTQVLTDVCHVAPSAQCSKFSKRISNTGV